MRNKLTAIFFVLLIAGIVGFFYVHSIFLPFQLKKIIINRAQDFLGREVTVGEINYNLIKGAAIKNLTIYRKDDKQWPFVHIDEIRFRVLLPAIFKDQKIVVPSMSIQRAYVHLIRTGEKEWNFSDLLARKKEGTGKSPFPFFLGGLSVEEAHIVLADNTADPGVIEIFEKTNFKVNLSLIKQVKYELETRMPKPPAPPVSWLKEEPGRGAFKAKGNYNLLSRELTAQISAQKINVFKYLSPFYKNETLALNEAFIGEAAADLTFKKEAAAVTVNGNAVLQNSALRFQQEKRISGTLAFKNISFSRRDSAINLESQLELTGADIQINPHLALKGNLKTSPAQLSFKDKTLNLATSFELNDADVRIAEDKRLSGALTAKDITLSILDGKMDIKGHIEAPQASFDSGNETQLTLSGKAAVDFDYAGPLVLSKDAKANVTAYLSHASITDRKQPPRIPEPITDISGVIQYDGSSLVWEAVKATFKNTPYTMSGQLTNLSKPVLEAQVVSEPLVLSTRTKILYQALTIVSLTGKYYNSPFDIAGEIHFRKDSGPASPAGGPDLDLKGHVDLDLANLSSLSPSLEEKLKTVNPSGIFPLDVLFRGSIQDWRNTTFVASSTGADISLWGYKFNNVTAKAQQGDRDFSELDITGSLYEGAFSMAFRADVQQDEIPFKMSAHLENTDLAKLKQDSPLKRKRIAGLLSLALNLAGPLQEIKSIQGNGAVVIRDGHLWEFSLIKGLWNLLLIPELEDIIFTEASADFVVENKRAVTNNLSLSSRQIDILGKGWIDLDKNISFTVTPSIKESALMESASLKKAPSAILAQVAENTDIRISGTLSNPKFEKILIPGRIIEKATGAAGKATGDVLEGVEDILKEGVKEILEGIFQ